MKWADGALLGEYTTLSFGESPKEENESLLSQILEASVHQKYYLSAKACQGILNRAERRGKELPEELRIALERQAHSAFKKGQENPGGGKGILIQNEHVGALSTVNNQSVLCLNNHGSYDVLPFDTTQITSPINGNKPKFGDPCHPLASTAHPPTIVFEPRSQDGVPRISDKDISPTLNTMSGGQRQPCVVQRRTTDNRNDLDKEHGS